MGFIVCSRLEVGGYDDLVLGEYAVQFFLHVMRGRVRRRQLHIPLKQKMILDPALASRLPMTYLVIPGYGPSVHSGVENGKYGARVSIVALLHQSLKRLPDQLIGREQNVRSEERRVGKAGRYR